MATLEFSSIPFSSNILDTVFIRLQKKESCFVPALPRLRTRDGARNPRA